MATTLRQTTNAHDENAALYADFFQALLQGNRQRCHHLTHEYLEKDRSVKHLYEEVFKRALYSVGELWEQGKISVATEHLASAIVEAILNDVYSGLIAGTGQGRKVVVTCSENEYHQIGAKMVADIFEMHNWKVSFLGANTPVKDLMDFISQKNPDFLAISMSLFFHLPKLENLLEKTHNRYPSLKILVGGQGFRHGGQEVLRNYPNTIYIPDLNHLEVFINEVEANG